MFLKNKNVFILLLMYSGTAFAEKPKVVGSTQNICSLLEGLAGGVAEVQCLSQKGQSPHRKNTFVPDASKLSNAHFLLLNGLGFENGYVPSLILKAKNASLKKIPVIPSGEIPGPLQAQTRGRLELSDLLEEREVLWDSAATVELKGESPTGKTPIQMDWSSEHPHGNPHFLLNPELTVRLLKKVYPFLVKLHPVQKKEIEEKSIKYIEEVEKISRELQQKIYFMAGRKYISYHADFSYWKNWLSIDEVLVVESKPGVLLPSLQTAGGVFTVSEHDVLKHLLKKMSLNTEGESEKNIPRWDGIIITPFSPKALMMWIAKELNLAVFAVHTDVLDSMDSQKADFGEAPKNYIELIQSWEKSLSHPIWTPSKKLKPSSK